MLDEFDVFCSALSAPLMHSALGIPRGTANSNSGSATGASFNAHAAKSLCCFLIPSTESAIGGTGQSAHAAARSSKGGKEQQQQQETTLDSVIILDSLREGAGTSSSQSKGGRNSDSNNAPRDCVVCTLTNWSAESTQAKATSPLVYQAALGFSQLRSAVSCAAASSVVLWSAHLPLLFAAVRRGDFEVVAVVDEDEVEGCEPEEEEGDGVTSKKLRRKESGQSASAGRRRSDKKNQKSSVTEGSDGAASCPIHVALRVVTNTSPPGATTAASSSAAAWTIRCRRVVGAEQCALVNRHMALTAMAHHTHAVALAEHWQQRCRDAEEVARRARFAAAPTGGGFVPGPTSVSIGDPSAAGALSLSSSQQQQQGVGGGAQQGLRNDVRKPQSMLNPAQRVSGKRGRGVKISGGGGSLND